MSAPTRPHSEPQAPASKPASQDVARIASDAAKPAAKPPAARPKHVAPEQLTGAQSVIRSLEELDVEVIFGIPGGAVLPVYDPLFDSKKLRHVLVRHEQGAGHAASGYAHATGKVGVMMATSGPGATNLVTPLADAQMDSIPVVAVTGQVSTGTSSPRAKKPAAKWAIGEMLITTGGVDGFSSAESVAMHASWHRPSVATITPDLRGPATIGI